MKCSQCGVCCKLFVINLNEEEYKSGRFKTVFEKFGFVDNFAEAELIGAHLLAQKEDGETCIYLQDGKCSIHQDRPQACREFFCESKEEWCQDMIERIREYKEKKKVKKNYSSDTSDFCSSS